MSRLRTVRAARRLTWSVLLLAFTTVPAVAQQSYPTRFAVPLHLDLGLPQGEFAKNVAIAGGFGGGFMYALAPHFALRAELDFMIYGSERRTYAVNLGPGGVVDVDVVTTNAIFHGGLGAQVGMPGPRTSPYVGGMIGFSNFSTTSRVDGLTNDDEPIEAKTNLSDNTVTKSLYAGLYFPTASGLSWDVSMRYSWNGESVRYLTRGDITDDGSGGVILNPRETRADLLSIRIGVMLGGKRR
jgi:hypothetical protein